MKRRLAAALVLLAAVPLALAARVPQNPFASKPAKEHALLQQLAGTWKASFKFLMPGMPGAGSGTGTPTATETDELLGELWVVARYDDPGMMGGRFSGAELLGYDPAKKKYVSAWADNQSTELALQEGTYDAATRTLTLSGESSDPMSGQKGTVRTVVRWSDDDHRSQTMFVPGPGGKEMQLFEITYERVK